MTVIVKQQDEISIFQCKDGDLAIESDNLFLGIQVICMTPESAITLGHALIETAKELIRLGNQADQENSEK